MLLSCWKPAGCGVETLSSPRETTTSGRCYSAVGGCRASSRWINQYIGGHKALVNTDLYVLPLRHFAEHPEAAGLALAALVDELAAKARSTLGYFELWHQI